MGRRFGERADENQFRCENHIADPVAVQRRNSSKHQSMKFTLISPLNKNVESVHRVNRCQH